MTLSDPSKYLVIVETDANGKVLNVNPLGVTADHNVPAGVGIGAVQDEDQDRAAADEYLDAHPHSFRQVLEHGVLLSGELFVQFHSPRSRRRTVGQRPSAIPCW